MQRSERPGQRTGRPRKPNLEHVYHRLWSPALPLDVRDLNRKIASGIQWRRKINHHCHNFEKRNFFDSTRCSICGFLFAPPRRHGLYCRGCGLCAHEGCKPAIPRQSTSIRSRRKDLRPGNERKTDNDRSNLSPEGESILCEEGQEDMLLAIFSFLSVHQLMQARQVCRKWRDMVADDAFWSCRGFRFPLPGSGVGLFDRSTQWSGTEDQEDETADLIVALCGPIKVLRDLLHHWKLPSIADIGDTWESRMRLCYGVKGVLKRKTQFVPFLLKLCEKEEDAQYIGRCDACIIVAPAHNHHHEDTEEGGIHNMLRIKQTITLNCTESGIEPVFYMLTYNDPNQHRENDEEEKEEESGEETEDEEHQHQHQHHKHKGKAKEKEKQFLEKEEGGVEVEENKASGEAEQQSLGWVMGEKEWHKLFEEFLHKNKEASQLDEEALNPLYAASNNAGVLLALTGVVERIVNDRQGFVMVPTDNPSRDEPGQIDVYTRVVQVLEIGGVVVCCLVIFIGELIIILPCVGLYHALRALLVTVIIAPFNWPLWLAFGAVYGLVWGVAEGLRWGVADVFHYLEGGWQATNAFWCINNLCS